MYTFEKAQTYTPIVPVGTRAKTNFAGKGLQVMTAILGREFMQLSTRHKSYVLYCCLSFMLMFAWNEGSIWPNVLNVLNFANAVRLANQALRGTSARD